MKIVILLLAVSAIQISAEECVGKQKVRLAKNLEMRCIKGLWKAVQRKSALASKPCEDNPELSANATCSADRGHCQQFTEKGSEMDRSCPGTCNSCDACNCQDSHQWHKYCSYWTQYCQDPGVLGTWMTSNCRKTCGKCRCPCCSYKGTSHTLGSRINLPQQCGVLECQESLIAGESPLISGAKGHAVSHPEELTLNFVSLQDGANCCILTEKAKGADGTEFDKDSMVEEGWGGSILMPKGTVQAYCCHGTMSVALEDVESVSSSKKTTTTVSSSTTTSSTTSTSSTTPTTSTSSTTPTTSTTSYSSGNVIEDGPYGYGTEGSTWTDGGGVNENGHISSLEIRSGRFIENIRVKYGGVWGSPHGGGGGSLHTLEINAGTKITKVKGRYGRIIDALELITEDGKVFGPYGSNGGVAFSAEQPGCYLSYLSGRASGHHLVTITLHWECP